MQFLKDHNCLEDYIIAFNLNYSKAKSMKDFFEERDPSTYISGAFMWRPNKSTRPSFFWSLLDPQWMFAIKEK